jgi:HEAT repeat protein
LSNLLGQWSAASPQSFDRAASALAFLGNAGLAPLVGVITNRNAPGHCRRYAAIMLGAGDVRFDTNGTWAVPVLIGSLDDPTVAQPAITALGRLRLEPELSVPALTRCLQDTNYAVRCNVAYALGEFETNASLAVPDLVKALTDSDWHVRQAATNALDKIAPQVLTNDAH